ncbi:MAG TPA: 2OG-Fe(II) oxygenase [Steroidobacteraceae bacterium]|nr:2OG-Fe(II) oxygenase [Steroidobacteraceae bacterium]
MRPPQVIDNFLPRDLADRLRVFVEAQPMEHGAKSNKHTDPHGHWSWKPFTDSSDNLADISSELTQRELVDAWEFVSLNFVQNMKLIRCYINGYGYGDDGYFHTDSDREGDVTVILYICSEWHRDWAGETMTVHNGVLTAFIPVPNRCVILSSNTPHAARAVSRKCTRLRRTLMFKCRPQRSMDFERLSQFLVSHGAHKIDHAEGSLHDHLVRVYELLEKRGMPTEVAYGGGLHSIYGTNSFNRKLLEPYGSIRAMVAGMFNRRSEELAWQFSVLARPGTLEDFASFTTAADDQVALKCTHAEHLFMPMAAARQLCLIECANLQDQGSLGRWPNLLNMWNQTKDGSAINQ